MSQPVLFDAPGPRARRLYFVLGMLGVILVAGLGYAVVMKLAAADQLEPYLWQPFLTATAWTQYLLPGLWGTLRAAGLAITLAGVFGLIFGLGRLSQLRVVRWVSGVVVEFFRAVPVLLMVIFAFAVFNSVRIFPNSLNPLAAVVTALTVYNGSLIAELIRSGVHGLPRGQQEAGLSIGLTRGQTLRQIQLPQALTAMLPALIGQMVVVLKDSALGYSITYLDLLNWSKTLGSAYANTVPAYIVAAMLFIVINYFITKLAGLVERWLNQKHVTAGEVTHAIPGTAEGPVEGER